MFFAVGFFVIGVLAHYLCMLGFMKEMTAY